MSDTQISLNSAKEKVKRYQPICAIAISLLHVFYTMIRITGYSISYLVLGIENALIGIFVILLLTDLFLNIRSDEGKREVRRRLKDYFNKEQILLLVFVLLSLVSVAVNWKAQDGTWLESNYNAIHDMCISCFLLFPLGRYLSVRGMGKKLRDIICVPLLIITVILVPVLLEIMQGNMYVPVHDGGNGVVGIDSRYQLCLWVHSNITGMYSAIIALLCIIGIYKSKSWRKCIFFIWIAFFVFILVMSNSRASFLSFSAAVSVITALLVYRILTKINREKRWVTSIISAIMAFFVLQLLRDGIMYLFDAITDYSRFLEDGADGIIRDLEPSNLMGRDVIWKGAIKSIFSGPSNIFFGVSPSGVKDALNVYVSWAEHTHNQFLEISMATGIPGLICFGVWLVITAKSCIIVGFGDNRRVSLARKILPVIILYLVINNLVEQTLVWNRFLSGSIFFFLSGWVCEDSVGYNKKRDKSQVK